MGRKRNITSKRPTTLVGKIYVQVKIDLDTLAKVDELATALDIPRCGVLEQLVKKGLRGE